MQKEASKRGCQIVTISFNGSTHDPSKRSEVVANAKTAMTFLKEFWANHLVVFPPNRNNLTGEASFKSMCEGFNAIGEAAREMGFLAGLHNHMAEMVQNPDEIDKCMAMTDPKLFHFAPDTAHLHLGGSDVVRMFEKYKDRLVFMDYKDARWTTPNADLTLPNGKVHKKDSSEAKFFESIYDLGDGDIDFPACHRILKQIGYKGWICVDLDRTRNGPRASYEHCGRYVVERLEPIYA